MTRLTMELADQIADATLAAGRNRNAQPLTVAVLDTGGHTVVLKRADGSGILRCEIATGKAWGALGMGLGSRVMFERSKNTPTFFTALAAASDGKVVPVPGGVLLRDESGHLMGAVGVSGDTSDLDEECAVAAIESLGLAADYGQNL
ncbi:GlcG/HbpS family heme-binding protein [Pelagibacterium montanilacus]|uniref:GlcG/HbpS family heme-binding protein n=1 Tax=Pelagibacterium montanilacus TaxID=2185280 RepID=UPI000F8DA4DD|nr:heme-binding protein [Pelagibacterium montanilacus]